MQLSIEDNDISSLEGTGKDGGVDSLKLCT